MNFNFKKTAGKFVSLGLISASILGNFGAVSVSANNLVKYEGEWVTYAVNNWRNGPLETYRGLRDVWGYWTLNGNVVWCLEPSIPMPNNDAGVGTYDNGVDVIKANSSVVIRTFNGNDSRNANDFKKVTAVQWLIYTASDSQLNELHEYFSSKNDVYGKDTIRMARVIRGWSRNKKWTSMQLFLWQQLSQSIVTHVSPLNGGNLSTGIYEAANDINGFENTTDNRWVGKNPYLSDTRLGSEGGQATGLRGTWTLRAAYGSMMDSLWRAVEDGFLEYDSGLKVYTSRTGDQRQYGSGGTFNIRPKTSFVQINKEFYELNGGLNTRPNFSSTGLKFGVYSNVEATTKVGELIVGANGVSNVLEVPQPGTYYAFELDVNGNPVKDSGAEVINGTNAETGYISGKDKHSNNRYVTLNATANNTASAPAVGTFVNTPEVVNFTFDKRIKDDKVAALEGVDPQYTRVGAVYTLYKDANATQEVTRNGQPVTATIGANGTAQFEDLYRGVYYVKETDVPVATVNGRQVKRFALDTTIHRVDLTNVQTNEVTTNNVTPTLTKEYRLDRAFVSNEELPGQNKGSLIIRKKDKESQSNKPQGQATLKDGHFKVEFFEMTTLGSGTPVKKWETIYKTDENGEIDVRKRSQMVSSTNVEQMNKLFAAYEGPAKEWGSYDYQVTEIKAPDGYKLDSRVGKFSVKNVANYDANFVWEYDDGSFYNDDFEIHLYKTQRQSGDWLPDQEAKKVAIKDATFRLARKDGTWSQDVTTNAEGKLQYDGVTAGEYTLREVSVNKYKTNGQVIELTIAQKDGTTKLVASSDSLETDENGAFNITNMLDGDVLVDFENTPKDTTAKLIKANEKGSRLEGAKFKLVGYGEDGLVKVSEKEITTNNKGELDFTDLKIGQWYTIEEVEAPQGYKLPAKRVRLKFRAEAIPAKNSYALSYQTITVDKTNENNNTPVESAIKKITVENTVQDGLSFNTDENQGVMTLQFDFVNNTWQKLPATGSSFGLAVGGAVLALIIGSAVFVVKKREA